MDLLGASGKLLGGAAVNDRCLRTKPFSSTNSVHSNVTTTDDNSTCPDEDRSVGARLESPHQVGASEKLVSRNNTVQILAGNTHKEGKSGPGTNEYSRKSLVVKKLVDGKSAADDNVGFDMDAESNDLSNLASNDTLLRKPELGNTVNQNATGTVKCLENRDFVTKTSKVGSASQSGRPGANDSNTVAVSCGQGGGGCSFGGPGGGGCCSGIRRERYCGGAGYLGSKSPVADEALQLTDVNRLTLNAKDARTLALGLLRADAAANRRKQRIESDGGSSAGKVLGANLSDELGNTDRNGARSNARAVFTLEATRCLGSSLLRSEAEADLLEVPGAGFRVLFASLDAGYLICHIRVYICGGPAAPESGT